MPEGIQIPVISSSSLRPNFDRHLEKLINEYAKDGTVIEVDFRELIPDGQRESYTHLIHPYPAKLLHLIPQFFLNNSLLSKPGDLILDPFSGSGTVMLETILANRVALGSDSNPLAKLISKVKTTSLGNEELLLAKQVLLSRINACEGSKIPNVVNIDYWFSNRIKSELSGLRQAILLEENKSIREFFLVCFSSVIKKVSNCDPRVSVPVRLRPNQYEKGHPLADSTTKRLRNLKTISASDKYFEIVDANIRRMQKLEQAFPDCRPLFIGNDARRIKTDLERLNADKVSMIVTSPPYAGAQKYVRSSSLSLGWLGFTEENTLRDFERKNIGREHYSKAEFGYVCTTGIPEADLLIEEIFKENPLRAHIASNYLIEMKQAFKASIEVLKAGGTFVLVSANNQVCGREFLTKNYLTKILVNLGLNIELELVDDIHSYGLMTKRNKTAGIIAREFVTVFRKQEQ